MSMDSSMHGRTLIGYVLDMILTQPSVQKLALAGIASLGRYNKVKAWKTAVDDSVIDLIRPKDEIDEKRIARIHAKRLKKAEVAKKKTDEMVCP